MITLKIENTPRAISPDLFGVFFEDLNYAADGGLYAELIQNRSFEYQATEQPTWNNLSFWELIARGGGRGKVTIGDSVPVHPNNPHYAVLEIHEAGDGVGLANTGFDGIPVRAGATYDLSLWARQLYMNERWGKDNGIDGRPMPLTARLEAADGRVIGETTLRVTGATWQRFEGEIVATTSDDATRFVLLAGAAGAITLDDVSLFPRDTFRGRRNGLRNDLAQAIADLKPRFVRFPGGCLAHGSSLGNLYHWKNTIGPLEQRKQQANMWGYHQSMGLGYFEYFQFCEDLGAKPIPVVPAGVTCQNACHVSGTGQQAIPIEQMSAYVQDVLDLIEWANGPTDSTWGAKRAEAGHPESFGLEYLGVGNEEHITPAFRERFKMIYDAVRAKHPEIKVIGTSGPFHSGPDYDNGWAFARELRLPAVDEHYYVPPDWFWENLDFYDRYPRDGTSVYLGEYAAHEPDRRSTLRAALAEAAYMTSMERNGDIVQFASYAPLLAKRNYVHWAPDLIYFDNITVSPTVSYQVQTLFSQNAGDQSLPVTMPPSKDLAVSCVRDSISGDVILKIVSREDQPRRVQIDLSCILAKATPARCINLSGSPNAETVLPISNTMVIYKTVDKTLPPHSLTILRAGSNNFAESSSPSTQALDNADKSVRILDQLSAETRSAAGRRHETSFLRSS
ncbi:MAG: alpha-L-arabinofuranosidase C-terminal domain-containing protein [Tepidisphaeraceae bacterium]